MLFVAISVLVVWLFGAVLALSLARAAGEKAATAAFRTVSRDDAA